MALFFNSENFGQICLPIINYKWFVDGRAPIYPQLDHIVRSDTPFASTSVICPYDAIGNGAVGAYVEILNGVIDGVGNSVDIGIIKSNDDNFSVYNVPTGTTPAGDYGNQIPFLTMAGASEMLNKRKTLLYFGAMYYDDNTSNNAQFVYFADANAQAYDFEFSGASASLHPHYDTTPAGRLFVNCCVTDDQISFLNLPDILPSVRSFTATKINAYFNTFLNSDVTTANGGAGYGLPPNFQGNFSKEDFGTGLFDPFSGSRGNAHPASDTILQSGLISIYDVSAGALHQLATRLHDDSFWATINKMWDNPNESIISLALFPVKPTAEMKTAGNIILGGVDTEIQSERLVSHAIEVSFGVADFTAIGEYYGSFLDYEPHTTATIFLPFIGQHQLRINDIQNTKVRLTYIIDYLNGDITAQIETTDKITRTIEQLHGNCAVQIPLTSSNYSQLYQSLISFVGNVANGNAGGAISDIMSQKVSHNTIGGMGASSGAHGRLDAFILLNRPKQILPQHYNELNGRPLQTGGVVSDYHGYTKGIIEVQIPTATEREKEEITSLFEGGVYLV